jgi:hypothetical protein
MRAPWKRAAAIALATCGFSALPFINGCKSDVEAADAKISVDADKAVEAIAASDPESARAAMANTASNKSASPDATIQADVLAAQADLDAAAMLMSGPGASDVSAAAFKAVVDGKPQSGASVPTFTPQDRAALRGIEQRQIRVEQLLSQIASVAGQMTLNNTHIAGYKALEPTKAREAVQKATNDAQKGEKGAWVAGTAPIPSLEGLKAREQELQKQTADLTAQRDDLNAKRGQALQEAAKFGQQADSATGKESVGFFTQAANQRKEAADEEVKIAQLEAQLAPLQQDLQLVQLQEKTISDVLATYAEQSQQIDNGWKNVQQRIDQASALTKALLEGTGAPAAPGEGAGGNGAASSANGAATPRSLAGLASELDNETKELQSLRGKAVTLLNSAFKHYDDAAHLAATLTKDLNTLNSGPDAAKLPDRRAWQERIALNSPAVFKLGQAAVQNRFARLYTDQYAEVARRNEVGKMVADALKGTGLAAPQSVAAALPPAGTVPVEVDTKLKEYQGDLKSDSPPFQKDASELSELAAGQTTPAGLQGIVAMQADVAYHWAANLINDASSTAGSGDLAAALGNVCHAALMATNYGQAQFYYLQGKKQEGDALLKAALDERGKLVEANSQNILPAVLPAELAIEAKPTGSATTAPAAPGTAATPAAPGAPGAPAAPASPFVAPEPATPATSAPATQPAEPASAPAAPGMPTTPGTTPPVEGTTPTPGTTPPPAPAPGTSVPAK